MQEEYAWKAEVGWHWHAFKDKLLCEMSIYKTNQKRFNKQQATGKQLPRATQLHYKTCTDGR